MCYGVFFTTLTVLTRQQLAPGEFRRHASVLVMAIVLATMQVLAED